MIPFGAPGPDLWLAACCVLVFGAWLAARDLPRRYALAVAAVKVAIPLLYFARDTSGSIHLRDDLGYYYDALTQVQAGSHGVWLYLTTEIPMRILTSQVTHLVYNLWNILSLLAFGPHYFAPVFFNVAATFVAGFLFFRILKQAGFSTDYSQVALVFFLLHWEVVSWSSFLNLKDVLVVTLTLAVLRSIMHLDRKFSAVGVAETGLLLTVLFFLRFYAPLLILLTWCLYLFLHRRIFGGVIILAGLGWAATSKANAIVRSLGIVYPGEVWTGIPRFLLTPQPWALSSGYEFLYPAAWLHLLLIVPALLVVPALWSKGREARLMLIFAGVVVLMYSMIPSLQGPRQRFQISFVFAWAQFHALRALFKRATAFVPARLSHTEP